MNGAAAPEPARLAPPSQRMRNLVFGAIGLTIVLGWVGDLTWATLVDRNPLLLIALNAKPRYLLLTVNDLDPWVYYPFATFRLLCTKPLVWLIGAWYGHRAVAWAERRTKRGAGAIRWMERHFGRWGWVVIPITSNNVVCLLAGSTGFPLWAFMALAIVGTLVKLWLLDVVGGVLTEPIDAVVEFVVEHRPVVVAASVVLLAVVLLWQRRTRGSELDELVALEHAMDDGGDGDGD